MPTNAGGPCAVPLVERLLSVPKYAREMIEVGPCHHRNIPYGSMCHEAASAIADLTRQLTEAKARMELDQETAAENTENYTKELVALRRQSAALQEKLGDLPEADVRSIKDAANEMGSANTPEGYDELEDTKIADACFQHGIDCAVTAFQNWLYDQFNHPTSP